MTILDFTLKATRILSDIKQSLPPNRKEDYRIEFGKISFLLHDVEASTAFQHFQYPAGSVSVKDGKADFRTRRGGKLCTLAAASYELATLQRDHSLPDDAEVTVNGLPVIGSMMFNPVSNAAILDYGVPAEEDLDESILDTPKDGLDPTVWNEEGGEYVLSPEAEAKLAKISKWAVGAFGIKDPIVHVIGSIASNSYSDDSDIDLHFASDTFSPDDPDSFNRDLRRRFEEVFAGTDCAVIGTHPVEVFFQPNRFQDVMSVGCYDVLNRRWESGPQILPAGFDPVAEYYEADMKRVAPLISGMRQTILGVYETAQAYSKATDKKFRAELGGKLENQLAEAWKLYQAVRKSRHALSAPTSKADALKKRDSADWKVADSAFKILDKFGYIMIMRQYAVMHERAEAEGFDAEGAAGEIISAVNENFSKNAMLSDSEMAAFKAVTEREIQGIPGMTAKDAEDDVRAWAEQRLAADMMDATVICVKLHGSRLRGDARPDSDLDAVVYYKGGADEDSVFYSLNSGERCDVRGVQVDFNPIRDEETGSIDDYMERSARYDRAKADAGKRFRIWVDDVREAPEGYLRLKSVREFADWLGTYGPEAIQVLDIDHDAGRFAAQGGDYSKILDMLEALGTKKLAVRLHSANPVGVAKMRSIIRRNGWEERRDIESAATDESVGSAVRSAALAAAFAMPGFAQPALGKAAAEGAADAKAEIAAGGDRREYERLFDALHGGNLKNLLATIAYNEAMLDYVKRRDDRTLIAVLNVIDNRAGGDSRRYPFVISEKSQFFSVKHVVGGFTDANYRTYDPEEEARAEGAALDKTQRRCWDLCNKYAQDLLDGKLPKLIGNRNMIGNKGKDNERAWEGWGKDCDMSLQSHSFGY